MRGERTEKGDKHLVIRNGRVKGIQKQDANQG